MEPPYLSVSYVSSSTLRQLFNASQYPELIRHNLLKKKVVKSHRLEEPVLSKTGFPAGTKSEIIIYHDSASKMYFVKVHQYVFPDGSLGGSGELDPKVVWLDGTKYCLKSPKRASLHRT